MAYKRKSPIPIAEGGTNALGFSTVDGVVYYDGFKLSDTGVGTANQVLTSNGAGNPPTFQTNPIGALTEIDGDTGTATGPVITFTGVPAGGTVTFVGNNASTVAFHVTDSSFNTVIGDGSLMNALAGGSDNTFIGSLNGRALAIDGDNNIGVGTGLFNIITTGDDNIAIGVNALAAVAEGIANVAIGSNALAANNDDHNIAIGMNALTNATGATNVAIGYQAGIALITGSANVYIKDAGIDGDGSTLRLGTAAGGTPLSKAFIGGIDGVNIGSVAKVVTMAATGDQLGTATITQGTGITVTPSANTITIAATGVSAMSWSVITANQSAVANNGYICNKASTLVLTLPASSSIGDTIAVTGINTALGWQIAQNANQVIHFGAVDTTTGATGTLTSSLTRDTVTIVCVVSGASSEWNVISSIGNPTVF